MIPNNLITITEAGHLSGRSRQAIAVAIRKGNLPSTIINNKKINPKCKVFVSKEDLSDYLKNRYSRLKCVDIQGKKIYDPDKGICSPTMFAKKMGIKVQRVYYYMRTGRIPFHRKTFIRLSGISDFILIYFDEVKDREFLKNSSKSNKFIALKEFPE